MGRFDMDTDSEFSSGIREKNLRQVEEELVQMQKAAQERNPRDGRSQVRQIADHMRAIEKKKKQIARLRRLRYFRCLGCGGCLTVGVPIFIIILSIAMIFLSFDSAVTDFFRKLFPTYDTVVTAFSDFLCWVDPSCS